MNTKISALPPGSPALATDTLPVARSGSNVSLQVSDILTNPNVTGVEILIDNNIGSNFFTPTSGLVLENQTPATGSGSQTTGQQDPPSIEFTGNYWNGAASAEGQITIWPHFSQTAGTISEENLYLLFDNQPSGTGVFFVAKNNLSATSGQNQKIPIFAVVGASWTGSASQQETWQFDTVLGAGANPTSTLYISHYGSTGVATLDLTNALGTGGTQLVRVPTAAPLTSSTVAASTAYCDAAVAAATSGPVYRHSYTGITATEGNGEDYTPTVNGLYRITIALACTTTGSGGATATGHVVVNNDAGNLASTAAVASTSTTTGVGTATALVYVSGTLANHKMGQSCGIAGTIGTAQYQLDVIIEYLGA